MPSHHPSTPTSASPIASLPTPGSSQRSFPVGPGARPPELDGHRGAEPVIVDTGNALSRDRVARRRLLDRRARRRPLGLPVPRRPRPLRQPRDRPRAVPERHARHHPVHGRARGPGDRAARRPHAVGQLGRALRRRRSHARRHAAADLRLARRPAACSTPRPACTGRSTPSPPPCPATWSTWPTAGRRLGRDPVDVQPDGQPVAHAARRRQVQRLCRRGSRSASPPSPPATRRPQR